MDVSELLEIEAIKRLKYAYMRCLDQKHWRELGEFIREQRAGARLSLRRLSDMAGISNPYLSQIRAKRGELAISPRANAFLQAAFIRQQKELSSPACAH